MGTVTKYIIIYNLWNIFNTDYIVRVINLDFNFFIYDFVLLLAYRNVVCVCMTLDGGVMTYGFHIFLYINWSLVLGRKWSKLTEIFSVVSLS